MLDNLLIRIFIVRWTKINPTFWRLKNVQNPYWRFYVNQTDGAFLELEQSGKDKPNELYPLTGGRAYFIPAMVRFNTRINEEIGHFFVHFDVLGIPDVAMRTIFSNPICLPSSSFLEEAVRKTVARLEAAHETDLVLECHTKAIIYEGLALYLESLPPEQLHLSLQMAIALKPILPAINYINNNLPEPLLNRKLAEMCQMSEDYFIRRFKESTGQTPGNYIREHRVRSAAQQLLFSEASIEQIAASSGFGSRHYLCRVFKAVTGTSPVAYRKAARI